MVKPGTDDMRASDAEREAVVEILRDNHAEGRIDVDEFTERMESAYRSKTLRELADLIRDLPTDPRRVGAAAQQSLRVIRTATSPARLRRLRPVPFGELTGPQQALRVLWIVWSVETAVNLLVWVLVAITTADVPYFWPAWSSGVPGVVLGVLSWFAQPSAQAEPAGAPRELRTPRPGVGRLSDGGDH